MGSLRRFVTLHLLPRWDVVAFVEGNMFAVDLGSHYTQRGAEKRARSLNSQSERSPGPTGILFQAQKGCR